MKIRELLAHIDSFAPFSLAEEWDNPGLLVGSVNAEVKKISVCLDAVSEAVVSAEEQGCNVLVCHHPLIFRSMKRVLDDSEQGRTIQEAIRRDVNIIAAHTNWDKAHGGVNDTLASLLGLEDVSSLGEFGVCGALRDSESIDEFLVNVKRSWGLSHVAYYGDMRNIKRVALCGGSGAEFWRSALDCGADIYLTADMKYHDTADAVNEGLSIGIVDHGEMERASMPELARRIAQCGVETITLDVKAFPSPLILWGV